MSCFLLSMKKCGRFGMLGVVLAMSMAISMLMSDKASAAGSTVASSGQIYYYGSYINIVLTFKTHHYGGQPYCDGTRASATGSVTGWNNPVTWDTGVAQPGWSKWQGYHIYGINANILNSAGQPVIGGIGFSAINLNGADASVSQSINVSHLPPGTYRLSYGYYRNHFCESDPNIDAPGSVTFTIPNTATWEALTHSGITNVTKSTNATANSNTSPTVTIDADVGDTIRFDHAAYLASGTKDGTMVHALLNWRNGVRPANAASPYLFPTNSNSATGPIGSALPASTGSSYQYTLTAADAGKTFCQNFAISPKGLLVGVPYHNSVNKSNDAPHNNWSRACVRVNNYSIYPKTSLDDGTSGSIQPLPLGETTTFRSQLFNNGPSAAAMPVIRTIYEFTIQPNQTSAHATLRDILNNNSVFSSVDLFINERVYYADPGLAYMGEGAEGCNWFKDKLGAIGDCRVLGGRGIDGQTLGVTGEWKNPVADPSNLDGDINSITNRTVNAGDYEIGTVICRFMATRLFDADHYMYHITDPSLGGKSYERRVSKPTCIEVTKSPSLQLRGSDSTSGASTFGSEPLTDSKYQGGFEGSSNGTNALRGSWSQYGLLTNGNITNFGSAGWTNYGGTPNTTNACKLWFANTSSAGGSTCNTTNSNTKGGNFGDSNRTISIPDNSNATTTPPGWSTPSNSAIASWNSGQYFANGAFTINGGSIGKDKQITLVVNGDLTITGDISAPANFNNLSEIPILNLVAKNIYIQSSVTNLFGSLIARGGAVYTCGSAPSSADLKDGGPNNTKSAVCGRTLSINGSVVSKDSPRWHRTNGGGTTDPAVPAEIVNYTPNLFLTPYYINTTIDSDTNWETVNQTGLPARY